MISLDRNVDFRNPSGFPALDKATADGTHVVRCVSHPDQEGWARAYLTVGIRVIAVYTGESDAAGRYVMQACSALQIGNEPQFVYRGDESAWPTGTSDDFVNVWSEVANVLVPAMHPYGLPLIGPGIWIQDYSAWASIANRLRGLSAAACHVYPGPSGQSVSSVRTLLRYYRGVRSDLPLICTEYHTDANHLNYVRAIDSYCDARLWQGYNGANNMGDLESSPAYGVLALTGS